jgi:hypothetical protein
MRSHWLPTVSGHKTLKPVLLSSFARGSQGVLGVADSANVLLIDVHTPPLFGPPQELRYAGPMIDPCQRLNPGSGGAHWTLVEQGSERQCLIVRDSRSRATRWAPSIPLPPSAPLRRHDERRRRQIASHNCSHDIHLKQTKSLLEPSKTRRDFTILRVNERKGI